MFSRKIERKDTQKCTRKLMPLHRRFMSSLRCVDCILTWMYVWLVVGLGMIILFGFLWILLACSFSWWAGEVC